MSQSPKVVNIKKSAAKEVITNRNKPKRKKYILRTALKRDVSMQALEQDNLKWLWAAYNKGAFVELIKPGLSNKEFNDHIFVLVQRIDDAFLLEAPVNGKKIPVGVVSVRIIDRRMEPHVIWFPWASDRNILEASLYFIKVMKKDFTIFIYSEEKTTPFFLKLTKYGILRKACKIYEFFEKDGELMDVMLFQTKSYDKRA